MGSSLYSYKDLHQLIGLRVVRGSDWDFDTQDGGEGFVGTVVGVVGNAQNPRHNTRYNIIEINRKTIVLFVCIKSQQECRSTLGFREEVCLSQWSRKRSRFTCK
jgi:hypothetical protein